MDSKTYRKLLLDDRWKEKAKYIRKRDNHTCQHCGRTDCRLDVHHKNYILGKNPWEIPSRYLITLCRSCHKKEHKGKKINEFYITLEEFRERGKKLKKRKFKKKGEKIWRKRKSDVILHRNSKTQKFFNQNLKTMENLNSNFKSIEMELSNETFEKTIPLVGRVIRDGQKNVETNKNWENLIDNLTLEQIQKPGVSHPDSIIYENQFDAAKKFVKAMMSYYTPGETEFTSRNHHLLVSALPQSGKTGFMAAVANIITVTEGLMKYLKINSIWFITGMNDTGLQKQTAERIELQVIGATDENVDSGSKDVNKTKDSFFKVYRNQELRKPEKLLVSKGDLKNAIIFIDEAHYGSGEASKLNNFFKYHGLDFKNRLELRDKAIYIASISATNTSEIFSDLSDSKQHIVLNPADFYYGPQEMLEHNQIYEASSNDFKINKITKEYPIIDYIKTAYNDMCKFAYDEIKPRYNPESGERDYSPRGCCFIRASKKIDDIIKKNEFVKEKFKIIQIDTSSSKKVNYESVFTEFLVMLNTPNQKPVIFLVKGGYRAGITKHPQIKDYTFMIYDRSISLLSTIQGLLGRMCGVRKNWDIASLTKFYVDKEHVRQYVDWHMSEFDREHVPAKYVWINSNSLSDRDVVNIKSSDKYNEENDFKMGTEIYGEPIEFKLTDEQIRRIYDIAKNQHKNSSVDNRLKLNEILSELKDENGDILSEKYHFIAETYIKPGGVTGKTIDGEIVDKYKDKVLKDWVLGKAPGGVKFHGYKHFEYIFGRSKFDETIDVGKIAAHVILNDDLKIIRIILRKLIPSYRVPKQEKNYQQHKDTSLVSTII